MPTKAPDEHLINCSPSELSNNSYSYTESKYPNFFNQCHKVDSTGIGF